MPTENELKYLLKVESESKIIAQSKYFHLIRQAYLTFSKGMSLRIRETNEDLHEMTFKQKAGKRVVEIETKINKRDFDDLWSVSINKLYKIRHHIIENELVWEIDAFKDASSQTYMLVAEHEMPEGMTQPEFIPEIIQKNLLYPVPREDNRFASKRLADISYAQKLYKSMKGKQCTNL